MVHRSRDGVIVKNERQETYLFVCEDFIGSPETEAFHKDEFLLVWALL
jgi:hypothetical protein